MTFLVVQTVLRILLALVFIGMGVSHFLPASRRTMAATIPPRLRWTGLLRPRNLVIFTGVCEIAGGLGLLFPPTTVLAGICLIVFLAAVFPANAYAAHHRERFGRVATPLVPRLIGQLVLMALIVLAIL
ncbi:DoxX family protein [Glaciibacter superstes]|uniref:DoxX family protein n=1 Tax=Glaciibacter superstes TaxID=501023 RepID=UPI0003B47760|nr:DoxX family protein [Glaciibacter superstes]